ncbi:MAG: hypothetical protein LBS81_05370, partial [Endomicrobium sp.]|nr:hypothetical protein [Endomicrobium sp.]
MVHTNFDNFVIYFLNGEIIEEGGITIPAKRFADIIKELTEEKEIEIKSDETNH